jgi:hypothetical protein
MSTSILVAIIIASGTLFGAIIAAFINVKADLIRNLFIRRQSIKLLGDWKSSWYVNSEKGYEEHNEIFHIKRQKGERFTGQVSSDEYAGMMCDIEGLYRDGFLQVLWYPSKQESSMGIQSFGCYFFKLQPDGSFKGQALGFYMNKGKMEVYEHTLTRLDNITIL